MHRVIAIDGPSGSGKSSVSRRVGRQLGFVHLDSGALYRILARACLRQGVNPQDDTAVEALAKSYHFDAQEQNGELVFLENGACVPDDELRTPEVNGCVSYVAKVPPARTIVTDFLRSLRERFDLITEGRDITTVVFPDTPARFYLTASAEARALRRQKEELEKGIATQTAEAVKASLLARDKIDSTRACAPLRKADGVIEIDSSNLTLEQVVDAVLNLLPTDWK